MGSCDNNSIGRLLYLTTQAMNLHAEKMLKPYDLTVEQLILLKNIPEDDVLSQNQLCEIVEKSAANVTRILDRLEKKGFITRSPNPADRRCTLIALSDAGRAMAEAVHILFESFSSKLTDGISEEEENLFIQLIHKIRHNLDKLNEEPLR